MKQVKLRKIKLTDFKGQNLELEFGERTMIYWPNAKGKSTIFNAYLWLLTGADSMNRSNHALYDARIAPLTRENSKPAIVEGWFEVDGEPLTLKRMARPQFASDGTRLGADKYDMYVDGMKMASISYKAFIASTFADADTLKFMLNPEHYRNVDWRELSDLLVNIIGKVNDGDLPHDYNIIKPLITKYGEDKALKLLTDKIADNRKLLNVRRGMIEAMRTQLPDLSAVSDAEKEVQEKRRELDEVESALKDMSSQREDMAAKYAVCEQTFNEAKQIYYKNHEKHETRGEELAEDLSEAQRERNVLSGLHAERLAERKRKGEELAEMRKAGREARERFGTCPYCHHELAVEEAQRLYSEFTEKGKILAIELDGIDRQIDGLRCQINDYNSRVAELRMQIAAHGRYEDTPEGKAEIEQLRKLGEALIAPVPPENYTALMESKNALRLQIHELQNVIDKKSEYDAKLESIDEAEADARTIAADIAADEGKVAAFKQRESDILGVVKSRIEQLLSESTVCVGTQSKNGRVKTSCSLLVGGVPADDSNYAAQTIAGIDLACALMRHYGLSVPMFIDNAEHITRNVGELPMQTVWLFASNRNEVVKL